MAKITVPKSYAGLLHRDRLYNKLDAEKEKHLIWVAGPGGCGKTTLISSYIQERGLPCLWYQVDQGDNDPATFFYYLAEAGRRLSPRRRVHYPLFTPEYVPALQQFSRNFWAELFNTLPQPCLLVLDNFQEADQTLHPILLAALDRAVQQITIVVCSRQQPSPDYARLRTIRQLSLMGWNDLRLTLEEFRGIIVLEELDLEDDEEIALYERTGGWAAGLRLLLDGDTRLGQIEFSPDFPETAFAYFATEVFDKLPETTRDFLLKTSASPYFTVEMAELLTSERRARRVLASLYRDHLFLEKRGTSGYQYHALFRDYLRQQGETILPPEERRRLKITAAEHLVTQGDAEAAAELFREAGEWRGLARLIQHEAAALLEHGRFMTLQTWLHFLGGEKIRKDPWLCYWQGICLLFVDQQDSRSFLEKSYHLARENGNPACIFLAWAGIIETHVFEWNDMHPLDNWIAEYFEIAEKYYLPPVPEIEARVVGAMVSALMNRQPEHPDLPLWLDRAEGLIPTLKSPNLRLQVGNNFLVYKGWQGKQETAERFLDLIFKTSSVQTLQEPLRILYFNLKAWCGILKIPLGESRKYVEQARELVRSSGISVFDDLITASAIYYSLLARDYPKATMELQQLAALTEHSGRLVRWHYYHLAARHARKCGDAGQALDLEKTALQLAGMAGTPSSIFLSQLELCHIHAVRQEYEKALSVLKEAEKIGRGVRIPAWNMSCILLRAHICLLKGEEADGLELLRQGLSLGRKNGLTVPPPWDLELMLELCCKALEAGIEVEHARWLVKKYNLPLPSPPIEVEHWPWPVRIYTLGRFEIVRDDQQRSLHVRSQQKPLQMLKAIIALGGRRINDEHLSELLWPDAEGDLQHQSFRTTLHRLRRLLDLPDAIRCQEGQLTIDPEYCWIDIWAFQRLASKAAGTWDNDQVTAAQLSRRAISLYQGQFMAREEVHGWMLTQRERLHNLFLRQVQKLGAYLRANGNRPQAIDLYWYGISVDPLVETFYQAILDCHLEAGSNGEAVRTITCCRETFDKLLGNRPALKLPSHLADMLSN
ncbi:MAG: BTAD domain-containing putative transcriptional regulator [Desulfobulbaceae bacterium]|nr:BTAD domain-containing putative transcriptional regulator [Desulfobulbaceae bacterium]